MIKRNLFTILSLALISVVIMAAVPMAQSELVGLTIDNQSKDYVTFKLLGPQFYFLTVKPHTSNTFTIQRGDYTQKFYSCGAFVNTSLDLTKKNTIVVPPCGEKAFKAGKASSQIIDGGELIKLVKVNFENTTKANLILILNGTSDYVFFIKAGDEATYTISRGTYEVQQWGCKYFKTFNYYPFANKETELTCPIW